MTRLYSVVHNQKYFAIIEDQLAGRISQLNQSNRLKPLFEDDIWDKVIEDYQNLQYIGLDEEDFDMIDEYFGQKVR